VLDNRQQRFDFDGNLGKKPPKGGYEPAKASKPPHPTSRQLALVWVRWARGVAWGWLCDGLRKTPGQIIAGVLTTAVIGGVNYWWFAKPAPPSRPVPPPAQMIEPPGKPKLPAVIVPFDTETSKVLR
jgi:hypothetical protein